MNEREEIRRYSMTSSEPAMKPPQEARLFEKVPIRRSTSSSSPKQLAGAGSSLAEDADPVRLVDHQPRPEAAAELDDRRQVADVRPSMEKTPSTTTRVPLPSETARSSIVSSLSIRLCRKGRRRAPESLHPSSIEAWSPASQMTVSPGSRIALIAPRFDW